MRKASFKSFYQEYPRNLLFGQLSLIFLFFYIKEAELANLADDNRIYIDNKDLTELLEILRKECETKSMIVNPYKFESMNVSS